MKSQTTKDIFEYVKDRLYNKSPFLVKYVQKDETGIIQLGLSVAISLNDSDKYNIQKMKTVEKQPGFMFWALSIEGKAWFHELSSM